MNFRYPGHRLEGMSEIQVRKSLLRLYFSWYLLRELSVIIKPNRFCYYVPNEEFLRETCVCDSFHTSHFHICWAVDIRGFVSSAVLSNSCQKTTMADFRYKSIKSWKIANIDLTQQFSLSIFTDFHYQSIKITSLLPIFIDWLLRAVSTSIRHADRRINCEPQAPFTLQKKMGPDP